MHVLGVSRQRLSTRFILRRTRSVVLAAWEEWCREHLKCVTHQRLSRRVILRYTRVAVGKWHVGCVRRRHVKNILHQILTKKENSKQILCARVFITWHIYEEEKKRKKKGVLKSGGDGTNLSV